MFRTRLSIPRLALIGFALATLAGSSSAQFGGPTPLAWRWSHSTAVSPNGAPLFQGDNAFVAVGNRVFSLSKKSGNMNWRFPPSEGIPGHFRNGIAMSADTVVAPGDNRVIYGIEAATGRSKWQYTSPVSFARNPVVCGKFALIALSDNSIVCLNTDDGLPAWEMPYKIFSGIDGYIAANETNLFYMTGNSELVSFSVVNKKVNWIQRLTQVNGDSAPVLHGNKIYINSGSFVAAVNMGGSISWQFNTGSFLSHSPAVSEDGIMVVTRDGQALILSTSGQPKSRKFIELGSVPVASPAAVDKSFIVPTSNGGLNMIDSSTGEIKWTYLIRPIGKLYASGGGGTGGLGSGAGGGERVQVYTIPASGSPVLNGSTLFVLARDGSLLAFDKDLGVDVTGPNVKMVWPNPGDQVSGQPPLELIFKIDDEAVGIKNSTLKITVDGKDLDYSFGRDGYAICRITTTGKNRPLSDGRRVVTVQISDWLGNATKAEFSLMVDNTLPKLQRPSNTPGTGGPGLPGGGSPGGGRGGGGGGGGIGL
jgi:outer membrane protein assembly factor BamB